MLDWLEFPGQVFPDVRSEFLLNILKTNRLIKTKFCIHNIIDKIYIGIVNYCLLQICNRVTAID